MLSVHSKHSCDHRKRSCKQWRSSFVANWQNSCSCWGNSATPCYIRHSREAGNKEQISCRESRQRLPAHHPLSKDEGLGMGWGWEWGPMLRFFFVILSWQCPQKCTPPCQTQVVALPDWCLRLLAAFAVTQSPGAQVTPQGPSATALLMPQQGPSPAPSHGPSWAGPTCRPMYWPRLSPSPRRCPVPRAGAAPVPWLPTPGWWDRPWLPGLALGEPPAYTEPWQVWMWTAWIQVFGLRSSTSPLFLWRTVQWKITKCSFHSLP